VGVRSSCDLQALSPVPTPPIATAMDSKTATARGALILADDVEDHAKRVEEKMHTKGNDND